MQTGAVNYFTVAVISISGVPPAGAAVDTGIPSAHCANRVRAQVSRRETWEEGAARRPRG
jgi:hypothetical protein